MRRARERGCAARFPSSTGRSPGCRWCCGRSGRSLPTPTSVAGGAGASSSRCGQLRRHSSAEIAGRASRTRGRRRHPERSVAAGLRAGRRVHRGAGARWRPAIRRADVIDAVIRTPGEGRRRSPRCRSAIRSRKAVGTTRPESRARCREIVSGGRRRHRDFREPCWAGATPGPRATGDRHR